MLTIKSRSHDYTVEEFSSLESAILAGNDRDRANYLVDRRFAELHVEELRPLIPAARTVYVDAHEQSKSFDALTPVFLDLLKCGLKRDGVLIVVGGGVLQDIGCFIASVLFRGVRWELLPTTLLAQADSCIGSKSSINIGSYKNQIGTFYPPHQVRLCASVLTTLPWDEVRSGIGEIIKLQLLAGEAGFRELMHDLKEIRSNPLLLSKWVARSMAVKQPYIEADEFDRGIRNLLNYGHTFGHAYESATHYAIPHGIAVILGILTATHLSARLRLVSQEHLVELRALLCPWHQPYAQHLQQASQEEIFRAIKLDKKNTGQAVNCILTRGFGQMEKFPVLLEADLVPAIKTFIENEAVTH